MSNDQKHPVSPRSGPGTSCAAAAPPAASGQAARPFSPLIVLAFVADPAQIAYVPDGVVVRCYDPATGDYLADVFPERSGFRLIVREAQVAR